MVPVAVEVLGLVQRQVLDQRLAIDPLAGGAGAGDRLVRLAAGGMDDVERAADHVGDHDRPVRGLALDRRRTGVGVALRAGDAAREVVLLQSEHDVAILGVDQAASHPGRRSG